MSLRPVLDCDDQLVVEHAGGLREGPDVNIVGLTGGDGEGSLIQREDVVGLGDVCASIVLGLAVLLGVG
jgi:hypothetical protein